MQSGVSKRGGHGILALVLCGFAAVSAASGSLTEKIIEDLPGRLVLELTLPASNLRPIPGASGAMRVECSGCHIPGITGAPDLPAYRFDVLTGGAEPRVSVDVLESDTRLVPSGIAPYPFTPTPSKAEYRVDPSRFRSASSQAARLLAVRRLRGLPLRGIEIPLASWNEGAKTLRMARKVRVQVEFPGTFPTASANRLTGAFRLAVKNPVGGAYLTATPRLAGLRKSTSERDSLGSRFIRIRIGDRSLESFAEDKVYGFSFADLVRAAPEFTAAKAKFLRVFAGPNDTLKRTMDSLPIAPSGTLREIPIEVLDKDNDGTMEEGDSVLFYAHGTSVWQRLPGSLGPIRYEFSADPYSFENYYYLDWEGKGVSASGDRLTASASPSPAGSPLAATMAYLRAEKDLGTAGCDPSAVKDEEIGYDWHWHWKGNCSYGEAETTLVRSQLLSEETGVLPDPASASDTVWLGMYVYRSGLDSNSRFRAYQGGQGPLDFLGRIDSPGNWYVIPAGTKNAAQFQLDSAVWTGGDSRFEGYTLAYRRKHIFRGEPLWIFPEARGALLSYKVEGGQGVRCLRVEDGVGVKLMTLDGQGVFTDSLGPASDARYLVYRSAAAPANGALEADVLPASGSAIRNLGDGDGKAPDYLIVTSRALMEQAIQLRNYRDKGYRLAANANDKSKRALDLRVEVVAVEDIYRQFSGGRLSPVAIRDFLRHAYGGWGDAARKGKLKYVGLFGDGHYDYRGIKATLLKNPPPNIVPPFEFIVETGREGVASDDFYGMLEPGTFSSGGGMLDVALGRIPVQTPAQAKDYLQKIADYENPKLAGEWRGRIVMAADDATQRGATGDLDPINRGHTTDTDEMGAAIAENEKGISVEKVYLLDYPLNSAFHKPEAAQDLLNLINRGALAVTYIGHGASNQWADEVLLQTNDALSRMRNQGRTPMVNAFSCTVGRFESLTSEGMSEQFVKAKGIGAIGAVSATRESFPAPNIALGNDFYERAFPPDSGGAVVTVGEALREAKNGSGTNVDNLNDLKYQLLGEPVLLLRKPQLNVSLTQVMDTIKALDCSVIKGKVAGGTGNGKVNIKIVAGSVHKTYEIGSGMTSQEVDKRGNVLFERTFPYKDGAFATDYFIPKQIPFGDSNAQVLLFAWDDSLEMEGTAAKRDLRISGVAEACADDSDGKGPRITITGCESKESGGVDFPDRVRLPLPYCLKINVEDSLGGVLSSIGPDEGTVLEIPGVVDPFHPQPGIDDLYLKSYQYSLDKQTMRPGEYLLKVSAQDGYGNMSTRQLRLELTVDSSVAAFAAYNVPNPMKRSGTTFYFSATLPEHELEYGVVREGDRLAYDLKVFDQAGRVVARMENAVSGAVRWDGRDRWGNLLANGVYFYQVTARQILSEPGDKPGYRTISSRRNVLVISR